jgi:hypothetical protein
VDYKKANKEHVVLINVDHDYFSKYNRAKGVNIENEEKRDKVTVVERNSTDGTSELIAGLVFFLDSFFFGLL